MRRLFPLLKHSTPSTQKSKWSTWWKPELPLAQQAGLLYAGAMAYTQQGQAAKAREAVTRLLALSREDPAGARAAQWLAQDTERRWGNPQGCVQALPAHTDN